MADVTHNNAPEATEAENAHTPAVTQSGKPDWAVKAEEAGYEPKKTIGEKKFDNRAYFWWAGVGTFIFTIISAYLLKDGKVKVPGKDYTFKEGYEKMTQWGGEKLLKTGLFKNPESEAAKKAANSLSGSAMLTSVTFFGGLVPLPFIRRMEHNKAKIVRRLNEKHGTAEDVAIGEENVKNEAPQSWGSIIKGRIAAWFIVFTTFAGIGARLIPKTFGGLEKDFEKMASKPGATVHKWPENYGKFFDASADKDKKITLEDAESAALKEMGVEEGSKAHNQMYRYKRMGNLAAVDVFATAMSASLLYVASKFFAKKSNQKKEDRQRVIAEHTNGYIHKSVLAQQAVSQQQSTSQESETEVMPRKRNHSENVEKREESYVAEGKKQAAAAEQTSQTAQTGVS